MTLKKLPTVGTRLTHSWVKRVTKLIFGVGPNFASILSGNLIFIYLVERYAYCLYVHLCAVITVHWEATRECRMLSTVSALALFVITAEGSLTPCPRTRLLDLDPVFFPRLMASQLQPWCQWTFVFVGPVPSMSWLILCNHWDSALNKGFCHDTSQSTQLLLQFFQKLHSWTLPQREGRHSCRFFR